MSALAPEEPELPKPPSVRIPPGRKLRVVGDVHGDARAFAFAVQTDRFVIQLGDLTDGGPDSAGVLRLMFRLIDEGRGLFMLGNHDRKLARALAGDRVRPGPALIETLSELDDPLRQRVLQEVTRAPAWLMNSTSFFVHAAFHSGMLGQDPPDALGPVNPLLSRALFGETTGRMQPDGFPERLLRWVNHIPAGLTVYCGHDQRSRDGRPWVTRGDAGGAAVFLDTGAGKGGHLSWIDI
jgi:hypothetical protein